MRRHRAIATCFVLSALCAAAAHAGEPAPELFGVEFAASAGPVMLTPVSAQHVAPARSGGSYALEVASIRALVANRARSPLETAQTLHTAPAPCAPGGFLKLGEIRKIEPVCAPAGATPTGPARSPGQS